MANGTIHREIASADRRRERSKQGQRASGNAIAALRRTQLESVADAEDTGEFEVAKLGVRAKGIPGKALGAALIILAIGAVIVAVLKARG